MTLTFRRWLLVACAIVFLIGSPALLLYALGYKYNWQKNRLEKTGVFYIKSYPKNATIILDNKQQKLQTPARLTRLLPNFYNLTITRPGYRSWSKNLSVEPQLTTFVEDVSLFKENLAWQSVKTGNFGQLTASPDKNLSVFMAIGSDCELCLDIPGNNLWLYNLETNDFKQLASFNPGSFIEIIGWSLSNQKILLHNDNDYLIANVNQENAFTSIFNLFKQHYTDLRWNGANDNIVYGLRQNRLYRLDVSQRTETLLFAGKIKSFTAEGNKIIYVAETADGDYLTAWQNGASTQLLKLPSSDAYVLNNSAQNNYLTLLDQEQNYLYLLNPANVADPVNAIFKNIIGFDWLNNQLIYWNETELWVYYPDTQQKALVERTSQKISQGFFHPNGVYVYGVTGNKLKVYELDGRDQRNIYELLDFSPTFAGNLITDKKGQHLFVLDDYQGQMGLYKIEIQE